MSDPLSFISTPALWTIVLMAVALGGGLMRLMAVLGPERPKPVKLEVTLRRGDAVKIIDAWKLQHAVGAARRAIYVDFAFLVTYGVLFAAAGSLLGRGFDTETVGALITYIGFVAPLFDVLENIGMLLMLNGHVGTPVWAATTISSAVKWALLFIAVIPLGLLSHLV